MEQKYNFFDENTTFAGIKSPIMEDKRLEGVKRLLDVMDQLRVQCPWDREQTFESLRNNTIEETYELVDAISDGDLTNIKKELGDLLLHVVFYSKIGSEQEAFDLGDVANTICDKLIYRHPHVFGTVDAKNSEQVMSNWEQLKLTEDKKRKGVLDGVPKSLPAMVKAYRIGAKASSAGFDWEKADDVWGKVKEEINEVEQEIKIGNIELMQDEFGDLFFSLINAARLYKVDPELALERCNKKFIRRFKYVEDKIVEQGKEIRECSLNEMEGYWNDAKLTETK